MNNNYNCFTVFENIVYYTTTTLACFSTFYRSTIIPTLVEFLNEHEIDNNSAEYSPQSYQISSENEVSITLRCQL